MTRHDRLEAYRIGLPRLNLLWPLLYVTVLPLLVSGPLLTFFAIANWLPGSPFPWHAVKHESLVLVAIVTGGFLAGYPLQVVKRLVEPISQFVQLNPAIFYVSERSGDIIDRLGGSRYRWTRVSDLFVTDNHICFCLGLPAAVLVPRSAFRTEEEADAFAEQAGFYWRRATGREDVTFNPAVVWPPAPSVTPSQEPDRRA